MYYNTFGEKSLQVLVSLRFFIPRDDASCIIWVKMNPFNINQQDQCHETVTFISLIYKQSRASSDYFLATLAGKQINYIDFPIVPYKTL
jgi:hypothetical protein